jgi:predicted nucleotidyltransferase component of viral defense system
MTLFDRIVDEALANQKEYSSLRIVVEKELFHHDILRIMSESGMLQSLTFIGGTCLRDCYGSNRLSEDLDFTGGTDFNREVLAKLSFSIKKSLMIKYGFPVEVSEPVKDALNVDTWKIKIQTRPERSDSPSQKIHIDICSLKSYEREPRMLLNHYGVDLGTGGLIIQAQSRKEILTDKFVALGLRPNRIKNRDLWDIAWLDQSKVKASADLLKKKLSQRNIAEI